MSSAPVAVLGCGMAVPSTVRTNHEIATLVDTSHEWIVQRTGIHNRRIAAPDDTSATLGTQAARAALTHAQLTPADIDLVIVATSTPDHPSMPATACLIQAALGVRGGAFDVSAACSGFVTAMATATGLIACGAAQRVLVVGAEVYSRIIDWTDRRTCILFGDGAGAIILGRSAIAQTSPTYLLGADGNGGHLLIVPSGGGKSPTTEETVRSGGQYLRMSGPEVYRFGVRILVDATHEVVARAGLTLADIDWIAPHQANARAIEAGIHRLGYPLDRVLLNIAEYGNTSSASIPIALAEAAERGDLRAGQRVLAIGFGGGLTWAAGIIEWAAP